MTNNQIISLRAQLQKSYSGAIEKLAVSSGTAAAEGSHVEEQALAIFDEAVRSGLSKDEAARTSMFEFKRQIRVMQEIYG